MNDIEKEQLKMEIQHIFDSGANEIRIFEMVKSFIESRNGVNNLTIPVVSNFVIQEIERRRDLILSEPDGIVREQMINNLALEL
jgi:hypothetical protein